MKIAWFDCFSGAAGDMIVAACLDAEAPWDRLQSEIAKLGLHKEVSLSATKIVKKGINATLFDVELTSRHDHPHQGHPNHGHHNHLDHNHHNHSQSRHLPDILNLIRSANLSESVKKRSAAIFENLARAEATVHGCPIEQIHFHEVGAADAIVDIVGACVAIELLGIEKIYCSALTVGGGTVRAAHGILPVPAPATAELIRGLPATSGGVEIELLTPTGAAILTTLAESYGPMPAMTIESTGFGAGHSDCPDRPNVLRVIVGQSAEIAQTPGILADEVMVLETNLDNCTGEIIGHTIDKLLAAGALDAFCAPIIMKKNRPAVQLSVICHPDQRIALEKILFTETPTFGIRRHLCSRSTLPREFASVDTAYGPIRFKITPAGSPYSKFAPEFDDCQKAAAGHNVSLITVNDAARFAWQSQQKASK